MSFAHLHLHSGYSFLDGAIRMDRLCQVVQQRGMNAVAVTDHGNMHGALDFYVRAQQVGIKPIMGIEAYTLGPNKKATDRNRDDLFHMVLLAENQTGWRNLKNLSLEAIPKVFITVRGWIGKCSRSITRG